MKKTEQKRCPLCEIEGMVAETYSPVLKQAICHECNYLIGLGFTNFDHQPPSRYYPATWVYDRIYELTGMTYEQAKTIWQNPE